MSFQEEPNDRVVSRGLISRLFVLFVPLTLTWMIAARPVSAGAIAVDSTAAIDPGACTLTSAISAAQAGTDVEGCDWTGDAIVELTADTYELAGQITVSGNVTLHGHGATVVRDDPAVRHRFFRVQGQLDIDHLTLAGGDQGNARGGAIKVSHTGTFTANSSTFTGNHADWAGGAIYSLGNTTVNFSTFRGNTTNNMGGAIYAVSGTLLVVRSTFDGNSGINHGGGAILSDADLTVDNSTFVANSAVWGGAIYQRAAQATITLSTFKNNIATAAGGGASLYILSGASLGLSRSALADDGPEDLCSGAVTSLGDNAASDASCTLVSALGDQANADVQLSDLVDHGGPVQVLAPVCDWQGGVCQSPLFDRYDCDNMTPWDQRNQFPRHWDVVPQPNGYPDTGDRCDIGAYESSCQTVYWSVPDQHQRVRLHRYQTSTSAEFLDNGACYAHTIDFDENLSDCSLHWEVYGGLLEITDIVFISDNCVHDCFTDPDLCAQNCQAVAPPGWFSANPQPAFGFRMDIPSCDAPTVPLQYVIEYVDTQAPLVLRYYDPRVPLDPPAG